MNIAIFTVGLVVFVTYMFFLLRMIYRGNKQQEKEHGKVNYKTQTIDSSQGKSD
tara:strand:- start:125 stop:286 length:162 start_codon:yes stop_codon:yes gene_type:complete